LQRVLDEQGMTLKADEKQLVGSAKLVDGRMIEDETSKRIAALVQQQLEQSSRINRRMG
jgi:histone deacetylase complex regulatory component SIN3